MSPSYVPYGYTPDRTFISVDLPAPFSPQIAWISPRRTFRLTSDRAFTPGNVLVMERISRMKSSMDVRRPRHRVCVVRVSEVQSAPPGRSGLGEDCRGKEPGPAAVWIPTAGPGALRAVLLG